MGCAIFVSALVIIIWYANIQLLGFNKNKYFDLCVADEFFKDRTNEKYESSGPPNYQEYNPRTNERIQVMWNIPVEQFCNNDTISISFINTTGEKLYYLGFRPPYYYVVLDYIIAPCGKVDTMLFYKWGDLEAINEAEYIPFKKKERITLKYYNPVILYPGYEYILPMDTEDFPRIIKEVYGDTVQIRYGAYLRGLPWNNRGFAIAYSDFIKIPINSIIDGWRKGKFTNRIRYIPEDHQEYMNVREDTYKLKDNFINEENL